MAKQVTPSAPTATAVPAAASGAKLKRKRDKAIYTVSVSFQTISFSDFENNHLYKKEINRQHQWHYILCHLQLLVQLDLQLQALRNIKTKVEMVIDSLTANNPNYHDQHLN